MRDVARRVELISLPLRLTMVAERAEAALTHLSQVHELDDHGQAALQNAIKFIEDAGRGFQLVRNTTMRAYSREAIRAYRISEQVRTAQGAGAGDEVDTKCFLDNLKGDLKKVLEVPTAIDSTKLAELRRFFRSLAEVCLSMDVGVLERVERAEPRSVSA